MSTQDDLFPWLPQLRKRFPEGNLEYDPVAGWVSITLPLKNDKSFRARLKWQEAKYLADNPELTGDELEARRFPADWPQG